MYYLYQFSVTERGAQFKRLRQASLFGCRVGLVPHLLRQNISAGQTEPFPWHLPVEQELHQQGWAFIIDLKPRNRDPRASLSLYEVRDVWGYSAAGWTPAMFRLRGLIIDGHPAIKDPINFAVSFSPQNDSIFEFMDFEGTVTNGRLKGRWTAPPRSSTNSVLLWPPALNYFLEQMRTTAPHVVKPGAA